MGICLTLQITDQSQLAVATVVSKLLEHFILSNISLSLVPQTISLV